MLSATKIASPVLYINSYIHRILAIPSVDSGRVEDVASRMILQDRPNKLSNTFLHIRQRIEQAGRGWSPCDPCGGPQFWGSIMMSKFKNAKLGVQDRKSTRLNSSH